MDKGVLIMSEKERRRLEILSRIKTAEITLKEGAMLLKLSYRQIKRIYKRYQQEGDTGLVHRKRGKPSNRACDPELKKEILCRYREFYSDFGPTLAAEKLAQAGYSIDHETLRRWLTVTGDWEKKKPKKAYRQRRQRRPHFGELVQLDGSDHHWFEERGDSCTLMNMIDDATNQSHAMLCGEESTENAMKILWQWIDRYGIPQALYTDRHMIYCPVDKEKVTQFGRACQELGIQMIYARSPQAKGRVERWNGIYQDRLVKELRLRQISDREAGNQLLAEEFLDELNGKFAVAAHSAVNFHRACPCKETLAKAFCHHAERILSNDWTIRWRNRIFQLVESNELPVPKSKIELRQYLDRSIHLFYHSQELLFREFQYQGSIKQPVSELQTLKGTQEYKKKRYLLIKALEKENMSKRAIASHVGISRKTVYTYLKVGLPTNQKRRPRKKLLQPYYKQIRTWLNETTISAAEVYRRLLREGYRGSRGTVKAFVREVKLEQGKQVRMRFSKQYQASVQNWLRQDPEITGKEIYKRLLLEGYTGSYETSQRCVRRLK